jgi:hypothetical protein
MFYLHPSKPKRVCRKSANAVSYQAPVRSGAGFIDKSSDDHAVFAHGTVQCADMGMEVHDAVSG